MFKNHLHTTAKDGAKQYKTFVNVAINKNVLRQHWCNVAMSAGITKYIHRVHTDSIQIRTNQAIFILTLSTHLSAPNCTKCLETSLSCFCANPNVQNPIHIDTFCTFLFAPLDTAVWTWLFRVDTWIGASSRPSYFTMP